MQTFDFTFLPDPLFRIPPRMFTWSALEDRNATMEEFALTLYLNSVGYVPTLTREILNDHTDRDSAGIIMDLVENMMDHDLISVRRTIWAQRNNHYLASFYFRTLDGIILRNPLRHLQFIRSYIWVQTGDRQGTIEIVEYEYVAVSGPYFFELVFPSSPLFFSQGLGWWIRVIQDMAIHQTLAFIP